MFFSTYYLFLYYYYYCYYYQSLHLKQQAAERAALEARKRIACTEYVDGRPKLAVIFGDGMTKQRIPKYGKRKGKSESAYFENRVFGFEVYCGPISGEILVHSDELVRGGANFAIEAHRLILVELARLLKEKHGMLMPEDIHFQLDNCGENKVSSIHY